MKTLRNFVPTNDEFMELPVPFEDSMRQLLGDEYPTFREALLGEPAVSIRLNRSKCAVMPDYERVPWATDGYYLSQRPSFTYDPLFHAGCYYVQEASSMFVEQAVKQHLGEARVALDLCAAPGGKSTLLRSILPDNCVLVSNEVMRQRAQVLAENVTKWGHPRCVVTSNYPADFTPLGELFDIILVDAPCSGEGMFRKDEVAVAEWSPENVDVCWRRQRDILTDIWPTLRPGGILIYSTCTFNTKEDEENVRWMMEELDAELLPVQTEPIWGITPSLLADIPHAYRFLPGRTQGEGFFLAVLRKNGEPSSAEETAHNKKKKRGKEKSDIATVPSVCKQWLTPKDSYTYRSTGAEVTALPSDMLPLYTLLNEQLRVLKAGVLLAELKGRDVLPTHDLAMSKALCTDAFARQELSYTDALRYLRRESITLSADAPRGFVIVTYRDVPLGFVKNLGNRANNLYPNEWRIRTSHLPTKEETIV